MAVILGATYPDVFAAVGAHSGLPFGAAHDVATAFAAMRGRGSQAAAAASQEVASMAAGVRGMPTIVFHGDRDQTVNPSNADAIIEQAAALFDADARPPLKRKVVEHTGAYGRRCTSTVYTDDTGTPHLEQWLLHGGAHAWSGGSAEGSFADEHGPDASTEMVRFFLAHRLPATRDS
jgi:poly(3-hydroxybutyrate) depolymerase